MLYVSIVTYKTQLEELQSCLNSLESALVAQIYIIDNSKEEYIKLFCEKQEKVTYIPSENVGYGPGHNIALRRIIEQNNGEQDYYLVLNSDVYFKPQILAEIIEYMQSNLDVAQLQPRITYPNGQLQYTCRLLPTPFDLIFRRFLPRKIASIRDVRYTLSFWEHDHSLNIPYHQGSFMFFRLSAFEKVGLFDERFFMYPEDIDITRRMHKYFKTMYWPQVTVVHAHRAASYKSKKMLKIHIVNMIKYFNKWGWFFDAERRIWNKNIINTLKA